MDQARTQTWRCGVSLPNPSPSSSLLLFNLSFVLPFDTIILTLTISFSEKIKLRRTHSYSLMSVPTGPLFFLLFCSLQAAGIIASLANPVYGEAELAHAVKVVGAKFVVTTEESIAQCLKIGVKKSQIILFGSKSDQSQDFSEFRQLALDSFNQSRGVLKASGAAFLTSDSPAAICFSSGTTGLPKAVMISGMNLIFQSDSVRLVPGFSSGEREATLTALPAFHIAGLLGGVDSLFEGEILDETASTTSFQGSFHLSGPPFLSYHR